MGLARKPQRGDINQRRVQPYVWEGSTYNSPPRFGGGGKGAGDIETPSQHIYHCLMHLYAIDASFATRSLLLRYSFTTQSLLLQRFIRFWAPLLHKNLETPNYLTCIRYPDKSGQIKQTISTLKTNLVFGYNKNIWTIFGNICWNKKNNDIHVDSAIQNRVMSPLQGLHGGGNPYS